MNKYTMGLIFVLWSVFAHAAICPDPETSSLKWGVPPEPWSVNPYSSHPPQGEDGTRFVRANVLVSGVYGRGIMCTYRNSLGEYSIWWEVLTKIPSRSDYHWINALGGFVCTSGLNECQFFVAN